MKDTRFSYFMAGRICAAACVVFLLVDRTSAQTNEMQLVGKPERVSTEIVARRDVNGRFCAAIQVVSDLTGLSYDSYNGVVGVDKKPGMDMVFVQPDERVLEIFCTGYIPLKIIFSEVGIIPREKEVWKITITGEKKLTEIPINILTNPEGATVFIDDQPLGNGRNFQVLSGKHTLRLTLDGHRPITRQIDVSEISNLFEYTLEVVEPVMLTITSNPTSATIFLDDVDEGQTNKQLFKFPGEYSLRISKSKYETIDQTITVSETDKNTWAFDLVKTTAILTINTTPADAGIWVNGEQKTTKSLEVAPGKYRIEIKKDGWYGDSRTVTVEKGQDQTQSIALRQMTGILQLVVEPMETRVVMKQGSQQIDTWSGSKYKKDIPVGQYTLEFGAAGYGNQSETVNIEEDKTATLNIKMIMLAQVTPPMDPATSPQSAITKSEFLLKIRAKYPEYRDTPDDILYYAFLEKFPVYKSWIIPEQMSAQPQPVHTASSTTGTVTDIDGNTYKTVKIGNQWWMAENLKVTRYRNGDVMPNVTNSAEWKNLTSGAYCNYDNNASNLATYGRLYNLFAVNDSRNIAPEGWHVPTDAEWQTLIDYLGGPTVAGCKMKEMGTAHWKSPNKGATNESGFSALPGGYRYYGGYYFGTGYYAYFWSSEGDSIGTWGWLLGYGSSAVDRYSDAKRGGFSVRCVRD